MPLLTIVSGCGDGYQVVDILTDEQEISEYKNVDGTPYTLNQMQTHEMLKNGSTEYCMEFRYLFFHFYCFAFFIIFQFFVFLISHLLFNF